MCIAINTALRFGCVRATKKERSVPCPPSRMSGIGEYSNVTPLLLWFFQKSLFYF